MKKRLWLVGQQDYIARWTIAEGKQLEGIVIPGELLGTSWRAPRRAATRHGRERQRDMGDVDGSLLDLCLGSLEDDTQATKLNHS